MQCQQCGCNNPAQAQFCMTCGARLCIVCPQCAAELPLDPYPLFCFACGARLAEKSPTRVKTDQAAEDRRLVSVLFADLAGWTQMSAAMDPEDVQAIQRAYFAAVTPAIEQHSGSVEKYIGDAVLAVFGAPESHEDDPERAVRAALAIQDAIAALNARLTAPSTPISDPLTSDTLTLSLRIGVHTGLVVSRVEDDGDFVITGDTVNLASRLQSAAEPGTVLVSADTAKLVINAFELADLGTIPVKGKAEPVAVLRVTGPKATPAKLRGLAGLESPLVGREAEMAALSKALERLARGVGGIVTIVGEAGIGKSRLVAEIRKLSVDNSRWIEGRCLSFGAAIPNLLWLDVLRSALGVTLDDPPEAVVERLRTWVQGLCSERFDAVYPYLARLMSLPLEAKTLVDLADVDGQTLKQRTFQAAEIALTCAANRQPLALVLEDLHWADPSSLELLERLLPLTDHTSLLVVLVFRPHVDHGSWRIRDIAGRDYRHRYADLWLQPLSAADSEALVGNLLRVDALPQSLRWRILSRAEGNPFFVEEVIRTLIDMQAIAYDPANGRWLATRDLADVPIPETLQGVIAARIDRLQADTRHLLQLASVIGRIFLYRVLAALAEEERDLEGKLLSLQREELIRERARIPELEYIFKHELTREAAYNGILKKQRRQFHRQVAEALERLFAGRLDEQAGLLAHHWERAGDTEQAVKHLFRAGDFAGMAYAHQEAIDFYRRALALLEQRGDRDRRARAFMKLGQAYHDAFDFTQAQLAYQAAFDLWEQLEPAVVPPAPHSFRVLHPEPVSPDPALADFSVDPRYIYALFRGLTRIEPDGEAVPAMARSWEILNGGRTYVFHLREDVYWSDDVPVTAHDFEYAWKRVLAQETQSPHAILLYDVAGAEAFHAGQVQDPGQVGVRAEGDHRLVVQLATSSTYFLRLVKHHATHPVPRHQVERWGSSWTKPGHLVSNGPFRLISSIPGVATVLARHPRGCGPFWGNVERVEFVHGVEDWPSRLRLYEEDRIDVLDAWLSTTEQFQAAIATHAREYHEVDQNGTWHVAFNVKRPPLDDLRVRQAMAHAIDRDQLVGTMKFRNRPGTGGFVPPGIPGYSSGIGFAYDPVLARRLMKDAGFGPQQEFPVIRLILGHALLPLAAPVLAQWKSVLGIECELVLTSPHAPPPRLGTSDAMIVGWVADVPDPDNFLRAAPTYIGGGWHDETFERLVQKARQLGDHAQRIQLYREADRLLINGAAIVPLAYVRICWLAKPWIRYRQGSASFGDMTDIVIEPH